MPSSRPLATVIRWARPSARRRWPIGPARSSWPPICQDDRGRSSGGGRDGLLTPPGRAAAGAVRGRQRRRVGPRRHHRPPTPPLAERFTTGETRGGAAPQLRPDLQRTPTQPQSFAPSETRATRRVAGCLRSLDPHPDTPPTSSAPPRSQRVSPAAKLVEELLRSSGPISSAPPHSHRVAAPGATRATRRVAGCLRSLDLNPWLRRLPRARRPSCRRRSPHRSSGRHRGPWHRPGHRGR